jgi:hypothetical protein
MQCGGHCISRVKGLKAQWDTVRASIHMQWLVRLPRKNSKWEKERYLGIWVRNAVGGRRLWEEHRRVARGPGVLVHLKGLIGIGQTSGRLSFSHCSFRVIDAVGNKTSKSFGKKANEGSKPVRSVSTFWAEFVNVSKGSRKFVGVWGLCFKRSLVIVWDIGRGRSPLHSFVGCDCGVLCHDSILRRGEINDRLQHDPENQEKKNETEWGIKRFLI